MNNFRLLSIVVFISTLIFASVSALIEYHFPTYSGLSHWARIHQLWLFLPASLLIAFLVNTISIKAGWRTIRVKETILLGSACSFVSFSFDLRRFIWFYGTNYELGAFLVVVFSLALSLRYLQTRINA